MARDFLIWFDDDEWEIRELGCEDYQAFKDSKKYYGFYSTKINKDGKLVYFNGECLTSRMFEDLDMLFEEECNFVHEDKKSFVGSFIDALEYIKKEFKNE